jgi:L-asparagine transporter-like permease
MSNEINLLQILYGHLKYLFFSLMNVRIIKFIQCGPCFINGPNSHKFHFLKFCTLQLGTWLLSHLNILYTWATKVFVVKILKQNNLFKCSLYGSLNFFFS